MCDRSGIMLIEVDGKVFDYGDGDIMLGPDQMISREQWSYMENDSQWCERNAPKDYKMRPREPVDFAAMKPIF